MTKSNAVRTSNTKATPDTLFRTGNSSGIALSEVQLGQVSGGGWDVKKNVKI